MENREGGFTLMELIIVVGVILVLSMFVLLGYGSQLGKAYDSRRKTDLDKLKIALENYAGDYSCYPDEADVVCGSAALSPYLKAVPCDPSSGTKSYDYFRFSCDKFAVFAKLDRSSDPAIFKKDCLMGCGPDYAYNYYVKSDGTVAGVDFPAVESGYAGGGGPVRGECGGTCLPNNCSGCCPGAQYRCDSGGKWCIPDNSCPK